MNSPAPPVVLPAISKQTAVVVFLHHSGANGLNWAKRFEPMRLPHVKYIFPNAPVRALSLYDGVQQTAWYDVHGYSTSAQVDEEGITLATAKLHQLLDTEIAAGTPSKRILLGGYSLGGSLALYSALLYDKPLAGCVIMNCWIADYRTSVIKKFNPAARSTPVFQMHGDNDPFIHIKYAKLTYDTSKQGSDNYQYKIYKNTSHWPTPEMFGDMKNFIEDRLPEIKDEDSE